VVQIAVEKRKVYCFCFYNFTYAQTMGAGDMASEEGCGETTFGEPCQLCLRKGRLCLKHSNNKPVR
jgi:hypothetical protein